VCRRRALDRPEATIDLAPLPNNDGPSIGRRDLASRSGRRRQALEDAPLSLEDTLSKMDAREVDCAMAAWESTRRARCVGSARDAYLSHAGRQKAHFRRAKLQVCALT